MTVHHEHGSEPSRFLVENIALLPQGEALDVAMGNGRNAVYLAEHGFTVTGVDVSEEAVAVVRKAAAERGLSITAEVADLEGGYIIPEEKYEVIICLNYLQRSLIPRIKRGLKPGGMVVYETFIVDQAQFGKPRNPDFLLRHNELLEMFRDFRCLRYREGIIEAGKAAAGIVAQKPVG